MGWVTKISIKKKLSTSIGNYIRYNIIKTLF